MRAVETASSCLVAVRVLRAFPSQARLCEASMSCMHGDITLEQYQQQENVVQRGMNMLSRKVHFDSSRYSHTILIFVSSLSPIIISLLSSSPIVHLKLWALERRAFHVNAANFRLARAETFARPARRAFGFDTRFMSL